MIPLHSCVLSNQSTHNLVFVLISDNKRIDFSRLGCFYNRKFIWVTWNRCSDPAHYICVCSDTDLITLLQIFSLKCVSWCCWIMLCKSYLQLHTMGRADYKWKKRALLFDEHACASNLIKCYIVNMFTFLKCSRRFNTFSVSGTPLDVISQGHSACTLTLFYVNFCYHGEFKCQWSITHWKYHGAGEGGHLFLW